MYTKRLFDDIYLLNMKTHSFIGFFLEMFHSLIIEVLVSCTNLKTKPDLYLPLMLPFSKVGIASQMLQVKLFVFFNATIVLVGLSRLFRSKRFKKVVFLT